MRAIAAALLAVAAAGTARAQVITGFPITTNNSNSEGIVTGPDGNLWFCEENGNKIGRMTPAGTMVEFPIPTADVHPETITVGPDGSLWFTELEGNAIGRITLAGVITEFPIPTLNSEPEGIAPGPDGNLWFTGNKSNKIGRVTVDGVITEFPIPTNNSRPEGMAKGPDGNMWFVENGGNKVGRITTQGVVTEFPIPTAASQPWNITPGPDGNLWFSEGMAGKIGRITPAGVITEFPLPAGGTPDYLTAGPDGNIWFSEYFGNTVARITPSGVLTEFPLPNPSSNPYGITAGPDGAVWFPQVGPNLIGRITTAPAVPWALEVDGSGNGVLEVGETVQMNPTWLNTLVAPADLSGTASGFTGPAGATYSITDSSASYGTVPAESTADCDTTGNCYGISIAGSRTQPHWDATINETESPDGIVKTWTLHVGGSFGDVPTSHQFYAFIETLFHSGVTGGCGPGSYCPDASVTRAQMAVFLLKGRYGPNQLYPPATGTVFTDVPAGAFAASYIEALAGNRITGGCGPSLYCPNNTVTRQQMAVFLLKSKHGSAYAPPACTGVFSDVPCPSQYADWIEQLAAEGITGGCGGSNYCPTSPNTRGQMAVFLTKTFGLKLYGP
jgi:streptogramin lyase